MALATTRRDRWQLWAWAASIGLVACLAVIFWLSPVWVVWIRDPEMPSLAPDLLGSGLVWRAALWFSFAAVFSSVVLIQRKSAAIGLLTMQIPLLLFHVSALIPIAELADQLRQVPEASCGADGEATPSGRTSRNGWCDEAITSFPHRPSDCV